MAIRKAPSWQPLGTIDNAVPQWNTQPAQPQSAEPLEPLKTVRERLPAATPELAKIREQTEEWLLKKAGKRRW